MTLESEGHRQAAINKASGESEAILLRAKATAEGIQNVARRNKRCRQRRAGCSRLVRVNAIYGRLWQARKGGQYCHCSLHH